MTPRTDTIAERCEDRYGGHTYPAAGAVDWCQRCGTARGQGTVKPLPPHCMDPACPSPAFAGREAGQYDHHTLPDGRTYHFACRNRMVRELLGDPPAITLAERAVQG